jgi:uncharacterized DUF497 family protein
MTFEWDRHNLSKIEARSFTAQTVEAILSDPNAETVQQEREPGKEPRWLTVGYHDGRRVVVVWTVRGEVIRIVTAWHESRPRKRP